MQSITDLISMRDNKAVDVHIALALYDKSLLAEEKRQQAEIEATLAANNYLKSMDPAKGDIPQGQYGVYYGKLTELSPYLYSGIKTDVNFVEGNRYVLFHNGIDLPQTNSLVFLILDNAVHSTIPTVSGESLAISGISPIGNVIMSSSSSSSLPLDEFIQKLHDFESVK